MLLDYKEEWRRRINDSHAKNEQNMDVKHSKTEKGKIYKAYV